MNPLTSQLANQHICDMHRAATHARLAREAHALRRRRRRSRSTR